MPLTLPFLGLNSTAPFSKSFTAPWVLDVCAQVEPRRRVSRMPPISEILMAPCPRRLQALQKRRPFHEKSLDQFPHRSLNTTKSAHKPRAPKGLFRLGLANGSVMQAHEPVNPIFSRTSHPCYFLASRPKLIARMIGCISPSASDQ